MEFESTTTGDANERRAMEIDDGGTDTGKQKLPRFLTWEDKVATVLDLVNSQKSGECEPQEQRGFSPSLISNLDQQYCVGSPVTQHTSSCGSCKNEDVDEVCSASGNMNQQCTVDIEHSGISAGKKELQPLTPKKLPGWEFREDNRIADLLRPNLTWDQMVVKVLHMIRCREFTEYNPKMYRVVPTRFCRFNIAFFDLDKESKVGPGPPIQEVPASSLWLFDDSVNVISIKVAESDVGYPINIYGTVLARDQYDYRCVYLFKRGRDDPQVITSPNDMLTLTGPYRALAVTGSMFFEFHLKIKIDGAVDKDFSKGLLEHNTSRHTLQPMTVSVASWLSIVEMVYSPVPFAAEASIAVNILKGMSNFTGKVTAWTTRNDNEIILYDNKVAGIETKLGTGGSVALNRHIVAVPVHASLVLNVSAYKGDHRTACFFFCLGRGVEECTRTLGPYELQVKVCWTAVVRRRRPKMWEHIGHVNVLW